MHRHGKCWLGVAFATIAALTTTLASCSSAPGTVPAWTWGSRGTTRWSPSSARTLQEQWRRWSAGSESLPAAVTVVYVTDALSIWDVAASSGAFAPEAVDSSPMSVLERTMTSATWYDWGASFSADEVVKTVAGVPFYLMNEAPSDADVWFVTDNSKLSAIVAKTKHARAVPPSDWDRLYASSISSRAKSGHPLVIVVPLARKSLSDSLDLVNRVENTLRNSAAEEYSALFSSASDGFQWPRGYRSLERSLVESTGNATTSNVRMTPDILTGLLLVLGIAVVTGLGVACLHTIQTPTRFHSQPLPVGKET